MFPSPKRHKEGGEGKPVSQSGDAKPSSAETQEPLKQSLQLTRRRQPDRIAPLSQIFRKF